MNKRIKELAELSGFKVDWQHEDVQALKMARFEKFAQLIVRECINKIETHQIPVGNSAAGEMACEWTYSALKEIRDEIREHFFGIEE